jgi:PKD repeat protein
VAVFIASRLWRAEGYTLCTASQTRVLISARMRPGRTAAIVAAGVVLYAIAPAESLAHVHAASSPPAAPDARVTGTFEMLARVTVAKHVRGEHVGQSLRRRWLISPQSCTGNVCQALDLDRERSAGIDEPLVLHRVAAGTYTGSGSFYVALKCKHKTYPHGSRAPYRITLTVSSAVSVQGIAFARGVTATYRNSKRSDSTPCVLRSHDAARYTGNATSAIPSPPAASFSTQVDGATDSAAFTDTSTSAPGGAQLVSTQWGFGDPASGAGDSSTEAAPSHQFSGPGVYSVTLTVTDANGLSSTTTQPVTAPGPPTAAFTATEQGITATFAFKDESTPGVDGPAIVDWSWSFGDPSSGAQDTSTEENPSHTFSAPGAYTVTFTVTDADGLTSMTTRQVTF